MNDKLIYIILRGWSDEGWDFWEYAELHKVYSLEGFGSVSVASKCTPHYGYEDAHIIFEICHENHDQKWYKLRGAPSSYDGVNWGDEVSEVVPRVITISDFVDKES
jgi:hypothetical protein